MADRISNARKKELEQPDPFLESMYKTLETAKKLKKQLIVGGIIVVSIISIAVGTIYTIRSADTKASLMLSDALKIYNTHNLPSEGYLAVKEQFESLISDYSNTSSGKIGRVRFADICYAAGEYEAAYQHYLPALDDFPSDPVMQNIILVSLGQTCQSLKRYQEAETYFKRVADGDNPFMKDDALFYLGMGAIETGETQKGIELLKTLSSSHQDSMYKIMADDIIARN